MSDQKETLVERTVRLASAVHFQSGQSGSRTRCDVPISDLGHTLIFSTTRWAKVTCEECLLLGVDDIEGKR